MGKNLMMFYTIAFLCSFATIFLKGIQHKNVNKDLYVPAFFTSYFMAFLDFICIGLIIKNTTWETAIAYGLGAALGMTSAMYLHNKVYKKFKGEINAKEVR